MSKRDEIRSKRKRTQRNERSIILIVIIIFVFLIAAVLIAPSLMPIGEMVVPAENPRPIAKMNSMGDPNAPVKVEEFSDFQCPFCRNFVEDVEPQVENDYVATGKVFFTYVPYSFIDDITTEKESKNAAQSAYCAGDQGKFWQYHDLLFANQTNENVGDFTVRRLKAFAVKLSLDKTNFNSCLDSGKYKQRVLDDRKTGDAKGVTSTPTFFVNGKLITNYSKLVGEIDAALNAK